MKRLLILLALLPLPLAALVPPKGYEIKQGNVIFLHPDGTAINHWNAARVRWKGPDGRLHWDGLPAMAVYLSHMKDSLSATSHGGGTTHAYGVKVEADSYGQDGTKPVLSASGKRLSIMHEAMRAGKAVGIVNSGNLNEPGTGVFLASVDSRQMSEAIVEQIIESGAEVILGGGEMWLLPAGAKGKHGEGARTDGKNLIERAKELGYTIVYNRYELAGIPENTKKLLGVFARHHTFHDNSEEENAEKKLPLYEAEAPTIAEMQEAALRVLKQYENGFFLVVEEEATDNFGNNMNARGTLEALRRADEAIGEARTYVQENPDTLLIIAADSDASGMQLIGGSRKTGRFSGENGLPARAWGEGGPLDGVSGTGSMPFVSMADKRGIAHPFAIGWISSADTNGAILVRAEGLNQELVYGTLDNTDIYKIMYATLFGKVIE